MLLLASQHRAWLLYYMVPILADILDQQYWIHAFHLASALHSLLSSSINVGDLPVVSKALDQFATDVKTLYGVYMYTHTHTHTHARTHTHTHTHTHTCVCVCVCVCVCFVCVCMYVCMYVCFCLFARLLVNHQTSVSKLQSCLLCRS